MKRFEYEDDMLSLQHIIDKQPRPDEFSMHAHEHPELIYFISGDIMFWVEGTPYSVNSGDFMLFNAAETHKVQVVSQRPYERIVLQLKKPLFNFIDKKNKLLIPFTSRRLGAGNLLRAADFSGDDPKRYILKMTEAADDLPLLIPSYLLPLLYTVYTTFISKPKAARQSFGGISAEVLSYVNENITRPLSPESISKKFFISRTTLYSLFYETAGSGVMEYINVKRLLMAKEQIMNGEKPTAVFSRCGFNDYSVFFRAYKKRFGLSPKADFENNK